MWAERGQRSERVRAGSCPRTSRAATGERRRLRRAAPWLPAFAVMAAALLACDAGAVELWESDDGEASGSLGVTVKWSNVLSHAPDVPLLYPERWSAESLWRLRLDLDARIAPWISLNVAAVERARLLSEGAGEAGGSFILPGYGGEPYRLFRADDELVAVGDAYTLSHDIDRASLAVDLGPVRATVGRQAIGWGRGVLFSATDLFLPFSPLDSDREWRAGVDAVRLSFPLTNLVSAEAVGVGGDSEDRSAVVGRLLGYVGSLDGELIVGRRGRDDMVGASMSMPVGEAEIHGEAAVFRLPEPMQEGGGIGGDDVVSSAVVGASYSLDLGEGVYLIAEYHYSGFGVVDIKDAAVRLLDPGFSERYARGDFSVLGRHALGLQVTYGLSGAWSIGCSWITSPVDGSGILVPVWTWLFSDSVTLEAHGYAAYGEEPEGLVLMSEYGVVPSSALVRISFYY